MSYPVTIDPELRRTLLEEIALQRHERGKFRALADDEALHVGIQLAARLRAEGCNRAIRALRDVWDASVAVERRHAESALWLGYAPGELQEVWGK